MIVVTFTPTGDTAEAETAEAAVVAARTMWDEAGRIAGRPGVTFEVDDQIVYMTCNRLDLGKAGASFAPKEAA